MGIQVWLDIIETTMMVVAVVGGAFWTVFLLPYLRQRAKASAEIRNLQKDTEKLQAEIEETELKIRREVRISVRIKADVFAAPEGQIVVADVDITNHGNQATTIKWADEPPAFSVRSVEFDEDGKPREGPPQEFRVTSTRDTGLPARSHVIRAGPTERLTFTFRPVRAGLYLLSFRGATASDVREEARKYGVALPTAWTAREYVLVGTA